MLKIASIVVTYNRLELLKKVISSLKSQTRKLDKIIVVNNSSTDGTEQWLATEVDVFVVNQANTGSSGGQYTGVKTAFELGYDWIWVMDDDVAPDPDCLENLLVDIEPDEVRAPFRYNLKGEPMFLEVASINLKNPFRSIWQEIIKPGDISFEKIPVQSVTFEGPIFHRSIVEKIGYPEKSFFIFADDTDYSIRALKVHAKIFLITKAKLRRLLPEFKEIGRFDWKYFYMIRNIIALDVLHGTLPVRIIRPWLYFISWLRRSRNFKELGVTIKAFISGYFYKSKN
ncbi:MAG: putative glycosyltransferase [Ignavibacteria bacterium]|nr:putative glycosyltransferase [Ignavibacteria bacterium]